jgi:hypothetical protein
MKCGAQGQYEDTSSPSAVYTRCPRPRPERERDRTPTTILILLPPSTPSAITAAGAFVMQLKSLFCCILLKKEEHVILSLFCEIGLSKQESYQDTAKS